MIGDQEDPEFLASVVAEHGPFDIVIDDGGHTMGQQIASIETLFPSVSDGGVYLVEDCHTSYFPEFDAGRGKPGTFIEWAKERIDDLHAYHEGVPVHPVWTEHVDAIHWYDSIVVFDKQRRSAPFCEQVGLSEHLFLARPTSDLVGEMLATRDAAVADRARAAAQLRQARDGQAAPGEATGDFDDELARTVHRLEDAAADRAELDRIRGSFPWRVAARVGACSGPARRRRESALAPAARPVGA